MRVRSLSCRPRWHLIPRGSGAAWRKFAPRELRFEELPDSLVARARFLWRRRLDTAAIAEILNVPEWAVFNSLRAWREQKGRAA